jgi:S-adenosylmethionine synthetase
LPSGAYLGLGLATAISIAVAATRLHRRRRRSPAPTWPDPSQPPTPKTIAAARKAHLDTQTEQGDPPPTDAELIAHDAAEPPPTHITAGTRDTEEIYLVHAALVGFVVAAVGEALTAAWLETLVNATDFRDRHPMVGSDVKVMVARIGDEIDVTAAIPVHPHLVGSWQDYRDQLAYVEGALAGDLKAYLEAGGRGGAIRLHLNTKDSPGRAYLAPFGTSLGKGDCGAVGRGNRSSGVIEPLRPAGCEAPAGKNPVHHGGKIYTALAREAARRIHRETGRFAEVTIAARNGAPLDDPAYVLIALAGDVRTALRAAAERIARETVESAPDFCAEFLHTDPVTAFHRQAAHDQ